MLGYDCDPVNLLKNLAMEGLIAGFGSFRIQIISVRPGDGRAGEIADLLATEILKRYYYQKGQIVQTLKNDAAIDTVLAIEATPGRYRQILTAPKADKK